MVWGLHTDDHPLVLSEARPSVIEFLRHVIFIRREAAEKVLEHTIALSDGWIEQVDVKVGRPPCQLVKVLLELTFAPIPRSVVSIATHIVGKRACPLGIAHRLLCGKLPQDHIKGLDLRPSLFNLWRGPPTSSHSQPVARVLSGV